MSIAVVPLPQQATQIVTFSSGRWMRLSGLTPAQKAALMDQLTIVNPRRTSSSRYTGFVDTSQPKHLCGYQDGGDGELLIAPGAAANAWRYLEATGAACRFVDLRPADEVVQIAYNGDERDYQAELTAAMIARPFAMGVGPCGSGKTDIAIRVMAGHRCRWLVVVEKRKLRDQWMERLRQRTGALVSDYKPGRKRRWKKDAVFVVALAQALIRHPEDVYALAAERPGVAVDECHHAPSTTFTDILSLGDFRYRKGFTATPDRADGTTPLMYWWVGPEAGRVDRDKVEEAGHLLRPRLEVLASSWVDTYDPDEPGDDYRLKCRMYKNGERLNMITRRIAVLAKQCRSVIVPVDSIAYGYAILSKLKWGGVSVEFCHAKPGKKRRADVMKDLADWYPSDGWLQEYVPDAINISKKQQTSILERVANGSTLVLIATSLADEGLDLPILDATVIATPSGSSTRIEQQMGRSCRPMPGKPQPLCVYILDPRVSREQVIERDGARETVTHRVFVNRFKRALQKVFRKMCDVDESAVRSAIAVTR